MQQQFVTPRKHSMTALFNLSLSLILIVNLFGRPVNGCMSSDTVLDRRRQAVSDSSSTTNMPSLLQSTTPLTFGHCGHTMYVNNGEDPAKQTYATTTPGVPSAGGHANIVNGVGALQYEVPWQAFLSIYNDTLKVNFLCGGSLISSEWVMTAAHCCAIAQYASYITVNLGGTYLNGNFSYQQRALQMVPHPEHDKVTHEYDACLVRIPQVNLTSWAVQPICMPQSCESACQTGETAVITGWGLTAENGRTPSILLQKGLVPIVAPSKCLAKYSFITENMVCAGFEMGGTDACQGDSGGPLACLKGGTFELDGITSFGYGCGQPGSPGVYTRICTLIGWISSVTNAPPAAVGR